MTDMGMTADTQIKMQDKTIFFFFLRLQGALSHDFLME